MRLIAQFEKGEELRYISHLDLMRAFQRALRRVDLKVAYSQGFNPHMETSFATALAVGASSRCEMIDIKLEEGASVEGFLGKMNATLPKGLTMVRMQVVDNSYPKLMAVVERAEYLFKKADLTEKEVADFMAQESIPVMKKSKKGNKEINLREYVHACEFNPEQQEMTVILSAGQVNIRPELFVQALERFVGRELTLSVERTRLFANRDGEFVGLFDL